MERPQHILFVTPWIYDFAAFDFWMKPLGLLSLAALFRTNGYAVSYLDCLIDYDFEDQAYQKSKRTDHGTGHFHKEAIDKPSSLCAFPRRYYRYGIPTGLFRQRLHAISPPDMVLVTCMMTYWYPGAFAAIRIIRESFPGVPILLGGNYVTLCPDHARQSGADGIFEGPGERHFAEIVGTYFDDRPRVLPDFDDLDSYPRPAYDLLGRPDQLPLLTSRGCPFHCSYCASNRLHPKFQRRHPLRVAEEIFDWHDRFGVRHFSIYDDAFLVDPPSLALPLLEAIVRRDAMLSFHCPNGLHLRHITPVLARMLFRAGVRTLRFGFETVDSERQAATGGKVNNDHLIAAVRYLCEAGYEASDIGVYLLCGLPGQAPGEIDGSLRFVRSLGARPVLAEYSPIPGTALWPEALEASPYDLAGEPLFHNNTLLPCGGHTLPEPAYRELKLKARIPAG